MIDELLKHSDIDHSLIQGVEIRKSALDPKGKEPEIIEEKSDDDYSSFDSDLDDTTQLSMGVPTLEEFT